MPEARRPRILVVTRNLPPLVGGMERLNWHMAQELARFADVRIVGPRGAANSAPDNVSLFEVPLKPLPWFLTRATFKSLIEALRWRPGIVLAGSGLMAPTVWLAAHSCGAIAAAYVHGLDVATTHPLYRSIWLPLLRRLDIVIANSRATATLSRHAGIAATRIHVIHPGVEPAKPFSGDRPTANFRARHALGDSPLLLSVGRLTRRKGLREFVTHVMPRILACRPDATLLVVGDSPTDALNAQAQSAQSIRAAASAAGVDARVKFLGRVSEAELLLAYQASQVHVFPVRHVDGNPEGFGMVAVEAAAHGIPTVAYATGGVEDAVAEGVSGRLVAPDDAAAFATAVLDLIEHPFPAEAVRSHARCYEWPRFGDQLAECLSLPATASPS